MYEFWYDYIKPKYQDRAKLWYMDTAVLLLISKLKIFRRTLLMVLKNDLTRQATMKMIKDRFQ